MLFHTAPFLVFILVVHTLYRALSRPWKIRLLLIGSYVFYGWWDYRFLSLILASTLLDFYCGGRLGRSADPGRRRLWLTMSVVGDLGMLWVFKYYDFFVTSARAAAAAAGLQLDLATLDIVLPVGISFYTFQTMSYTIDIYRGRLEPARSFELFALFVAFFPQLVAGPIERARALLPQLARLRNPTGEDYREGIRMFFVGLFQKVVVADNLAIIADRAFTKSEQHSGALIGLGILAFGFQIYGDFNGYSLMARGVSRLFGVRIMVNFRSPYLAVNPSDFWRRWHISLSTWLRDYLYIPLGGRGATRLFTYRNLALTMLLGGLWHGAEWNFVAWGAFHGAILIIYHAIGYTKDAPASKWKHATSLGVMFVLTNVGWLLFRVSDLRQVPVMLRRLLFHFAWTPDDSRVLAFIVCLVAPVVLYETVGPRIAARRAAAPLGWARELSLALFVLICFASLGFTRKAFIYFQF